MNYENIIRTRFQSYPVIIPNITQRRTRAFMTSSTFSTNSQTQSMMRGTTTLIKSTLSLVVRGGGGGVAPRFSLIGKIYLLVLLYLKRKQSLG